MNYLKNRVVFKQVVQEVIDSINGTKGKWSKEFHLFNRIDANTEVYKIGIGADNRSPLNMQAIDYFVDHLSDMIDKINQGLVEYFNEDEDITSVPRVKRIQVFNNTEKDVREMSSMTGFELSYHYDSIEDLLGEWDTGVHKFIEISMEVDYINYLTEWLISKIRQDNEEFGDSLIDFGKYHLESEEQVKTIVHNATKGIRENGLNRLRDVRAFLSDMIDYDYPEVSDVARYLYAELVPSRFGKAYKIITIEDILHTRNIAKEKKLPVEMESEIISYMGGVKRRKTRAGKKQTKRKQTKKRRTYSKSKSKR